MKIALLFEHPTWSDDLVQTFDRNAVPVEPISLADLSFSPDRDTKDFDLVVNRVNIMPSKDRDPSVVFHTLHYLSVLEARGIRVINGSRAHFAGASKALQNALISNLGLDCPAAVAVYRSGQVMAAAERIGFPLIVKPNIGGSGSGIARYDSREELALALAAGPVDFGVDGTGLVQSYIRSDGYVYRVEILGDRLFYSIRQKMQAGTYNYCAADGCAVSGPETRNGETQFDFCALNTESRIQPFDADPAVVDQVIRIIRAAGADLGGVEYLLDQKTGRPCFYDFNPYSNFVSDGEQLLGFSPEQRFVDYIRSFE